MTLSTSQANDIVILFVYGDSDGAPTGVSDTSGLTWALRSAQWVEYEYYAKAPNPLVSDTITIQFSQSHSTVYAVAFGVSGANYLSPFDPSAFIPSGADAVTTTPSANITPSGPSEMILGGFSDNGVCNLHAGAGFSFIFSSGNLASEYQITGAPTSVTGNLSGCGPTPHAVMIADAIVSALTLTTVSLISRAYDVYGNPATLTDPRGNVTSYTYSSLYNYAYPTSVSETVKPGSTQITRLYTYDLNMGTLRSMADPNGYTTTYQYDILGRLTSTDYPTRTPGLPQLDGSAMAGCANNTKSCSVTFQTSHPSDVIVMFASETLGQSGPNCPFSVSDTASLTWTARSPVVTGRQSRDGLQEFYAKAANTLSSDTITESLCSSAGNSYNGLQVFAISGANFNNPFDTNSMLPGTGSDSTSGQQYTTSATISTSNATDFIFAGVQHGTGAIPTPQSGFTTITSAGTAGTEYKIQAGTLTNFGVTFSFSTSSYWQEIADAIQLSSQISYPDSVRNMYNDAGHFVDVTNEHGWQTRQIYDGLGRLSTTDRFLGGGSYSNQTYTYNWQDRMVSSTDALRNRYYLSYDALGRTTSSTTPDSQVIQQSYNDLASSAIVANQDGNFKCNYSDRLGRLISVVEYANSTGCITGTIAGYRFVTNYYYDEVGNLRRVSNAASRSTAYFYDSLNRLTSIGYPDGTMESYAYDKSGNPIKKVDRASITTLTSFDSLDRPLTTTYCGATIMSATDTYDKNGNILQDSNQNATLSYIYDSRNRTLNETYAVNPATRTVVDLGCSGIGGNITRTGGVASTFMVGWTYTGELLNTLAYPKLSISNPGITIKYAYDGLGRVLNVTNQASPAYYARSFTYYPNDKVKGLQFGNNLIQNYTYDGMSRPSAITLSGATIMSLNYAHNKTGTLASVTGQVNGANVNEQYRYDPLQRLTNSSTTSGGSTTISWYEYDNLGNRVRQKLNDTITAYTYNSINELTASSAPGTSIAYSYDANGNQLARNSTTIGTTHWTYIWDASSRLQKVKNDAGVLGVYAYDGHGRRVESSEASTTFYAYIRTEVMYENITGVGGTDYLFAGAFRIAKLTSASVNYYHSDSLGSTRLITSSTAGTVFRNGYQPFGQDNGTPTGSETYRFTGKPYSSSTGLYYDYQRWSDPSTGRFISSDPIRGHRLAPQSLNPYLYTQDDPTSVTDPTGLDGGFGADNRCEKLHACPHPTLAQIQQEETVMWIFLGFEAGLGLAFACVVACPIVIGALSTAGTGCEEDPEICTPATDPPPPITDPTPPTAVDPTLPSIEPNPVATEVTDGGFSATRSGVGSFTNLGKEIGVKHLDAISKAGGFQRYLGLIQDTVENGVDTTSIEGTNPSYLTLRNIASKFFVVAEPQSGTIVTAFYNTPSGPLASLWKMMILVPD